MDKNMNEVLKIVDGLINKTSLSLLKKIKDFERTTGKSRSSFYRYKRFLKYGIYIRRKADISYIETREKEKTRLKQIIKGTYKIEFALNKWMKETGKSRSSFYRLKKET